MLLCIFQFFGALASFFIAVLLSTVHFFDKVSTVYDSLSVSILSYGKVTFKPIISKFHVQMVAIMLSLIG